MFCPEDGTKIEPYTPQRTLTYVPYPPCGTCGVRWVYNGADGRYEVAEGPTWKDLYAPYCTCRPGDPDEACSVDGYGVFMRHKECREVNSA